MGILNLLKKVVTRQKPEDSEIWNIQQVSIEDQNLISIAEEMLLGRMTTASNGGGGFENVTMIRCTGVEYNNYHHEREVRFDTDDSWIKGVYYGEKHLMKMYGEYLKTGKKPKIHPWRD